jgi:transposase
MSSEQSTFVGIDVSKDKLDICVHPEGRHWRVSQGELLKVVEQLQELKPCWIVLEATGGYEIPLLNALTESGLRVARPHVTRMSYHAKGSRQHLTKTDKLDAKALAHYAACYQDELRAYEPDTRQELFRCLYQRRQQLINMRTQEKNRAHHQEIPEVIQQSITELMLYLDQKIQEIEDSLKVLIARHEDLQQKHAVLKTMVGIGDTAATGILALLPELGRVGRKQIAAMVGVVPVERSSGKYKGRSGIRGGRFVVRQLLYMSVLSAIRYSAQMKAFYQHLKAQGKTGKQAIVACMHKMLRILNAMLKHQQTYQPT